MRSASKVMLNTCVLYGRMLLTVGVSLYTTRLVLNALGHTDYGIFNLVAGVIAMLSFLNTAMATSTQRFLSFNQGKNDRAMQRNIFINSLFLHVIIGGVIVVVLEMAGLILFADFLNIPPDRIEAAKTIFHYMSITVFFSVISVPFVGILTSHENMIWIAVVNITETTLRLGIAWALLYIDSDKLIVYGILNAGISVISLVLYGTYCFNKYSECAFKGPKIISRGLLRKLTSFAGWNLFGTVCGLSRTQGIAILLNLFLGAVVNAAYGIANQVASQLNFFSATLLRVLNPQIMKSEGANDRSRMLRLSMMASKFGFFLLAFIAVPCIFEMESILIVWLGDVPDGATVFCILNLVGLLVNQLTIGLQSAIQATGRIKVYQTLIGTVLLLNLPIAYLLLHSGKAAYTVLVSFILIEAVACTLRLVILKSLAGLSINTFVNRVFMREIIPLCCAVLVCFLVTSNFEGEGRFIITIVCSSLVFIVTVYFLGLCQDEKILVDQVFCRLQKRVFSS
ncbi:Na+-driven multidrug efflux pump [Arcticibacter pallidicorallinus]|uniref:Na+-driven multidrug efflux pump n=1 Tax=Arcticibacter pallidicorallinus TaxID=1259464 RepID=A0A2T0UBG9_9SPHI|nr:oligosaccharide flippase family protein [Arcticibacter pallidicorallinus]PRY55286.1 Na+-driven multidrug efflux pump [Arcticibacter pallidicorallinus]